MVMSVEKLRFLLIKGHLPVLMKTEIEKLPGKTLNCMQDFHSRMLVVKYLQE